ncbi:MAG: lipopolysaccharide biosynthesis protein [Bacteroidota bacterium]
MPAIIKKLFQDKNFQSLSGHMIFATLGFLSFIILTRSFPKEIFGEWVLYVTAAVFIEMLRFGLTKTAMVRYLAGADETEQKELKGSNYLIGLGLTTVIAIVLILINTFFYKTIENSGYALFFKWYPLLAFINLPYNNAITILQAHQRFDRILFLKSTNIASFVLFLALNLFFFQMPILSVVIAHLIVNLVSSVIAIILGWDGSRYLFKASRSHIKKIIDFGKYAIGTLIGSNLLKSADTFIIGISPILGPTGVAMYSVPMKLTELLNIPLRSFVATAFPKMSKAAINKQWDEVRKIFYTYSGSLTYLFIGIAIAGIILAEPLVIILGGKEYAETANIFRIFCIYGLFLPLDRFTGVALDSLNKPSKNMRKVLYMTMANIIGDLLAIFVVIRVFPEVTTIQILMMVAVVTIIMTIIGQIAGFIYVNREIKISYLNVFKYGKSFFQTDIKEFFKSPK